MSALGCLDTHETGEKPSREALQAVLLTWQCRLQLGSAPANEEV